MKSKKIGRIDISATWACLGALVFWSGSSIFVKYLTGYIDSWTQNLLRYSAACIFWLPYLLICIRNKRLDKGIWRRAIWPVVANLGLQSCWARSLYYVDPAFASLLMKTQIIWTVLFSFIFFCDERVLIQSGRFWLGLVLSVVGVFGVLFHQEGFGEYKTLTGVILALVTAFMWGLYTVLCRRAFRDVDSRVGFSVVSIYTVGGLFVLANLFGRPQESFNMGFVPWCFVVVSGVLCIALSHVLYYAAMRRIGAMIPSIVMLSTPFIVLGFSRVAFGEVLSGVQLVFGVVLLSGAAIAILGQSHLKTVG